MDIPAGYYRNSVDSRGYVRLRKKGDGRKRNYLLHRVMWASVHGEIPEGMQIHHIDDNKANNAIENLQCVTDLEHRRIHAGWFEVLGVWWKPCRRCEDNFPVEKFAKRTDANNSTSSYCRECRKAIASESHVKRYQGEGRKKRLKQMAELKERKKEEEIAERKA
jgi:hypothetical protein